MIYLASDHRGFIRKEEIKKYLLEINEETIDVGDLTYNADDDEVDFVAAAVSKMNEGDKGFFFCGSGVMVDMAANRYPKIRSCLGFDENQVREARNDDDANVLGVAADFMNLEKTKSLVMTFLKTPFSGEERYIRRIKKIS